MSRLFKKRPVFRKNYLYFHKSALYFRKRALYFLQYAFVYVHVKIDVCVCPESCAHILTPPPSLSVLSLFLSHTFHLPASYKNRALFRKIMALLRPCSALLRNYRAVFRKYSTFLQKYLSHSRILPFACLLQK